MSNVQAIVSGSLFTFFYKKKQNLINIKLPQLIIITPAPVHETAMQTSTYTSMHESIHIHSIQESLGPGTHSPPPEVISIPTRIPTSPQYHPPCCSSPPHQLIAKQIDTANCFQSAQIITVIYIVNCTFSVLLFF